MEKSQKMLLPTEIVQEYFKPANCHPLSRRQSYYTMSQLIQMFRIN